MHLSPSFDVADRDSANSQRMVVVLVSLHANVIIFDVSLHSDVIIFDVANLRTRTVREMVLVPHHPRHERKKETTVATGGRGKDLTDPNKSSIQNCYRLQGVPYQCRFHQEDSSLPQGDSQLQLCSELWEEENHRHHGRKGTKI